MASPSLSNTRLGDIPALCKWFCRIVPHTGLKESLPVRKCLRFAGAELGTENVFEEWQGCVLVKLERVGAVLFCFFTQR